MTRLPVLILLAACQSPLATPMVSLEPEDPHSGVDLVATVAGADEFELVWFRNGSVVDGLSDGVVPASMTSRGDSWRVEATVSRKRKQVVGEASASIRNAPPEVELTLAPADPQAGDALVVAVVAWDADDDPVTVGVSWTRDGQPVDIVGDTVPADTTRRGEVWAVEVVANDGFERGPAARAEATVVNAAPMVIGGTLSPAEPRTNDDITVSYGLEDSDGDPVSAAVSWSVNGAAAGGTSHTLSAAEFEKGDVVAAIVVPTDGSSDGSATRIGPVTVVNSAPTAPSLSLQPADPIVGESLHCRVSGMPYDADGDAIAGWDISWTVDGEPFSGAARTDLTGDTVPAGITQGEQVWRCRVQASDGEDWSAAGTASRVVEFDGFRATQVVAGRTVTCASVANDEEWTECTGLKVDGQAFPNGLTCGLGWSTRSSPFTQHDAFCREITGSTRFEAYYDCDTMQSRVTWVSGAWGSRDDNGYTGSLRCHW